MGSGQVFRPHFASPLHPWLGGDKTMVGGSSPSWHSPFTKPPHYAHAHSSSSPAPHSNSYSYTSSGLFASAFTKDETMAGGAGGGGPVTDYSMAGGGDGSDLKSAPMLSPLSACANKSGREGAGYSSNAGVSGGGGEASATPLLPSYPPYPGSLGGGSEFPNPYYPPSSHFNKALGHDKPKSKPRSSAGKTRPSPGRPAPPSRLRGAEVLLGLLPWGFSGCQCPDSWQVYEVLLSQAGVRLTSRLRHVHRNRIFFSLFLLLTVVPRSQS